MNNRWNRVVYKMWAPMYDIFFNSGAFLKARKKLFSNINVGPELNILFVGIGTGADLPFMMDKEVNITGIDLS